MGVKHTNGSQLTPLRDLWRLLARSKYSDIYAKCRRYEGNRCILFFQRNFSPSNLFKLLLGGEYCLRIFGFRKNSNSLREKHNLKIGTLIRELK